jgi:hypothetical protein
MAEPVAAEDDYGVKAGEQEACDAEVEQEGPGTLQDLGADEGIAAGWSEGFGEMDHAESLGCRGRERVRFQKGRSRSFTTLRMTNLETEAGPSLRSG